MKIEIDTECCINPGKGRIFNSWTEAAPFFELLLKSEPSPFELINGDGQLVAMVYITKDGSL
jgi:hypothetical protein